MDSWKIFAFAGIVGAIAFGALVRWLDLVPPTELRIAAGGEGSAYYEIATRYAKVLARDGITLEIVPTKGSVENAALVSDAEGSVDLALIQGGVPILEPEAVEALAAVFLEPIWIFHDGALERETYPPAWSGIRIAVGAPGSGTRFVFERMATFMSLDPTATERLPISGAEAAEALIQGEIDVAFLVAPLDAPYLRMLFGHDTIRLSELRHTAAIAPGIPFVELVQIPELGIDYSHDIPPTKIDLLAPVARLVGRVDLHPAAVNRLLRAADALHSAPTLLVDEGRFPSVIGAAIPMDPYARDILENGPSGLERVLPYWAVAQFSAIAIVLLPLLILLVPLMRVGPAIFEWQVRSRVYKHYPKLRRIDEAIDRADAAADLETLEAELDDIDRCFARAKVTPSYRNEGFTARIHADFVRRRLRDRHAALGIPDAPSGAPASEQAPADTAGLSGRGSG